MSEEIKEEEQPILAKKKRRWKTSSDIVDYPKVLGEISDKYTGKDDILGMSSLSLTEYMSSSRATMLANHLKQRVNLKNTEFPRVFTNMENLVGDNSSYKVKAETDCTVFAKVPKFDFAPNHLYYMFTYDSINDKYDLIIKKNSEELVENFGYSYNTEGMDSLNVGDEVKAGDVFYKSNGYTEEDCYGYGINALTAFVIDVNTIEDGIEVSQDFAKKLISNGEERIKISINDNDYPCNIYGDEDNYKGFPDIGEPIVDHVVVAFRRLINDQILYDMKKSNLMKLAPLDDRIYYSQGGKIMDIDIFCNKSIEEIPKTEMNAQLLKYIINQERFYSEIVEVCQDIIDSGSSYSDDIGFWYKRAKDMIDQNYEFFDNKSSFSNIIVEMSVEREEGISVGSKLTGRFGNKGVVSVIVRDNESMPYLEDGRRIEVKMNAIGICNRLITGPLYEQAINAASNDIADYMKTLDTNEERYVLMTRYLENFNDRGMVDEFKEWYTELNDDERTEFFEDVTENHHLYVNIPPMWGESLFEKYARIIKEFKGIVKGRYTCYVNKWGRKIKIMKPILVGEQYIMKLKQSSKKGFSARSLGFINMKGLPDKTNRLQSNLQLYNSIPVKWGIDESLNIGTGTETRAIAEFHLLHRNSVLGRREMSKLLTEDVLDFEEFEIKSTYKNRNVEMLNALLKCKGQGIVFPGDEVYISQKTDTIESYLYQDGAYLVTEEEMREIILDKHFRKKFKHVQFVGSEEEREAYYQKYKEHELRKLDPNTDYVYHSDDDIV